MRPLQALAQIGRHGYRVQLLRKGLRHRLLPRRRTRSARTLKVATTGQAPPDGAGHIPTLAQGPPVGTSARPRTCAATGGRGKQISLSRSAVRYNEWAGILRHVEPAMSKEAMANEAVKGDRLASVPSAHLQARILAEALPHMQRYDRQTVVVKYGGHAMGDPA